MDTTWSVDDRRDELERFEDEARAAGLQEASVRTDVDRSRIFLRWLADDCQFHGSRRERLVRWAPAWRLLGTAFSCSQAGTCPSGVRDRIREQECPLPLD